MSPDGFEPRTFSREIESSGPPSGESLAAASQPYSILTFSWGAPAESMARVFPQHAVEFASSARDALVRLNARPFDAYVLDYFAPDWGGAPLCGEIRKHDPHVPIIFYSGYGEPKAIRRALRAGANNYLVKSSGADLLAVKVAFLLEAADRRNAAAAEKAQQAVAAEAGRLAALASARMLVATAVSTHSRVRTTRLAANKAFIAAGGTCAAFERWWSTVGSVNADVGTGFRNSGAE